MFIFACMFVVVISICIGIMAFLQDEKGKLEDKYLKLYERCERLETLYGTALSELEDMRLKLQSSNKSVSFAKNSQTLVPDAKKLDKKGGN